MSTLHTLAEILSSLIAWFDNRQEATAVAIVMTAMFLNFLLLVARRHLQLMSRLKSGAKNVRQAFADPSWSAADRLNSASFAVEKNPALGQVWLQYRATIREDPQQAGAFVNLIDPHAWFAPERLPGAGYEKWARALASVFLMVGLAFTVTELSVVLLRASEAGVNAFPLRDAINVILGVPSADFITSIAGIVFFVLWILIARWFSSSQQHAAAKFAAGVQALTTIMAPEAVLVDQLLAAQNQTDRIRTLAGDLAVGLEAKLTAALAHSLDAVPPKIDKAAQTLTTAIEGIGVRIAEELRHATGSEMREVVEALKRAVDELRNARGLLAH